LIHVPDETTVHGLKAHANQKRYLCVKALQPGPIRLVDGQLRILTAGIPKVQQRVFREVNQHMPFGIRIQPVDRLQVPKCNLQQMVLMAGNEKLPLVDHSHQIPQLGHRLLVESHQGAGGNVVQHKLAVLGGQKLRTIVFRSV